MAELETVVGKVFSIGVPSASSIGREPWRRAKCNLYHLACNGDGWQVLVSERRYSLSEDSFIAVGERQLTLSRNGALS